MVSVCMASFNGEKYIHMQINSILQQLSESDELIISDNGSFDNTVSIIKSFNDPRIKLHSFTTQKNVIFNFQNALLKASGDYIFMSDQDDVWLSGRVEKGLNLLKEYDLVVNDAEVIDQNGVALSSSLFKEINSGSGLVKNFVSNTYYGCCMCFRRSVMSIALPFPIRIPMHDIWLGFVGDLFFKTSFCSNRLIQYRRHTHNVTQFKKSTSSFAKKMMYRINLVRCLPLLFLRRYRYKR